MNTHNQQKAPFFVYLMIPVFLLMFVVMLPGRISNHMRKSIGLPGWDTIPGGGFVLLGISIFIWGGIILGAIQIFS
jgi:hypothetical protein